MPNLDDARTISRLKIVVTSQADGVASGLSKIAHSLAEMKSAMKGGFGSTLTKLANQIERLAQALDKIDAKKLSILGKAMKDIRAGGAGNVSIRFTDTAQSAKKMGDNIEKATEAVKEYKNEIRDIIVWSGGMPTVYSRPKATSGGGGGGYVPPIFPGLNPGQSGGGGVAGLLGEGGKGIDISGWFKGGVHFDKFAQFTEFLGSIRFNFGDLSAKLASVKERASGFFQQLKRIAMYRAIRWVLKTITEYISTGVKNLYQYSKLVGTTFAPTMDSLASSALFLKNSLGVVAGQLIESVAPVLIRIVDAIAEINNQIAMTIAYLRGNSTYTKAVKVAQEYDDTLSHIRATLLGFDEINRMDGANGQSGLDYSKMFVEDVVDKGKAFGLLTAVTLIGEALGLWKVTTFIGQLTKIAEILGVNLTSGLGAEIAKIAKVTAGITLTVASIAVAWQDGKLPTTIEECDKELMGYGGVIAGLTLTAGPAGFALGCAVDLTMMIAKVLIDPDTFNKQLEIPGIDSVEEFVLSPFVDGANQTKKDWQDLKDVWNDNILPWFEGIGNSISSIWTDITQAFATGWRAITNLFKIIQKWWNDTFSKWWNETIVPWGGEIANWWDNTFGDAIDSMLNGLKSMWYDIKFLIRELYEAMGFEIPDWLKDTAKIPGAGDVENYWWNKKNQSALSPNVPKFASGGFPEDGLFYANHGEMVGQFSNGKTAVANNQEITAGIAQAVYQAIVEAGGIGGGDWTIEMVSDGMVTGQTVITAAERANRRNGKTVIAVG